MEPRWNNVRTHARPEDKKANRTPPIADRSWKSRKSFSTSGRRRKIFLTSPLIDQAITHLYGEINPWLDRHYFFFDAQESMGVDRDVLQAKELIQLWPQGWRLGMPTLQVILFLLGIGSLLIIAFWPELARRDGTRAEAQPRGPQKTTENPPTVRPYEYGKEPQHNLYGLFVTNPGYAAFDVHIPPVRIGMKSTSVSFLKNPSAATEVRLFVGRWAITLSTSSVTGVSSMNKGFVMLLPP
jgi:hypothetical protein